MITITESAQDKIRDLIALENNPNLKLRVFVQGGGCSGFQTGFTLDDVQSEEDWDIEANGVHVLIDSMSGQYLQGATVDYVEERFSSSFTITGMVSKATCGCGSSFTPF